MKLFTKALLLMATIFFLNSPAWALKTDRDQPAQIEADETDIDFRTGRRILTNNVLVLQGTLRIKADKLVADYGKDGKLVKAVADGNLARFKQRPDDKPDDVEGWGKKIEVDYPTNTLTLIGKAALKQGGTTATGDKIVYNMETDKLKIMGGSEFSSQGKNGTASKPKKLKDPFGDDDQGPASRSPETKKSKWESGKSSAASSKSNDNDKKSATENTQTQTYAPAKNGRSRLILQPKKKEKEADEQTDVDESEETESD